MRLLLNILLSHLSGFKLSVVIKRIIIVIIKVLHCIFIYSSLGCQAMISFEDVHIGHITQHVEMERGHDFCGYLERRDNYSRSSPCDLSRKWPALLAATLVKPQLNCDINFVMKSSRRQPVPVSDHNHFWDHPTGLFFCFKLS